MSRTNMWKLLVILLLIGSFLAFNFYANSQYDQYIHSLTEQYEGLGVQIFIEPFPFSYMWYGQAVGYLIVAVLISILLIIGYPWKKPKIIIAGLILLFTVATALSIHPTLNMKVAQAEEPLPEHIFVNARMMADEECVRAETLNKYVQFFSESSSVLEGFKSTFAIDLECVELSTWFSDNSIDDMVYLLQQALEDNGGIYDGTFYKWIPTYLHGNPEKITDVSMFITDQATNMIGLAVPDWNALMITIDSNFAACFHEFSHLFFCQHCNMPHCYMNPSSCYANDCNGWCDNCKSFMLTENNRARFGYKQLIKISTEEGGFSDLEGTYQVYRGVTISITATPNQGYILDSFEVEKHSPISIIYATTNPYTFTVGADEYWIRVHFKEEGSVGGGCGRMPLMN